MLCVGADALREGTPEAIRSAAAAGANFTCGASDLPLPLDEVIIEHGGVDLVAALLDARADPNARWGPHGDRFPIQEAQHDLDLPTRGRVLRLLLSHGADPNQRWCPFESRGSGPMGCRSAEGMTPLMTAALQGDAGATWQLLRAGADPMLRVRPGALPIDAARTEATFYLLLDAVGERVTGRGTRVLEYLDGVAVDNGNAGPWDQTALSRAIAANLGGTRLQPSPWNTTKPEWVSVAGRVRALLALGADPNRRVTVGGADWPPLSIAIAAHDSEIAAILLASGARVDDRWCVPVDLFAARATPPRRPEPGCDAAHGTTPLMFAAERADPDIVSELLARGADIAARDWQARTATDYAVEAGQRASDAKVRARATTVRSLLRTHPDAQRPRVRQERAR